MGEFPGFLGWATAILYGAAVVNYIFKRLNKYYINKLPKERVKTIRYFRLVMKFFIKNHKWFGLGAGVVVICHFILMSTTRFISTSGLVALTVMAVTILIGIIGQYKIKNPRGVWVKYHRVAGILVLLFILLHI